MRWGIRSSGDKIGAWLFSGRTSERMAWLELDKSGKETGCWMLQSRHTDGIAFAAGVLYSVTRSYDSTNRQTVWTMNTFDRTIATWKAL